MTNKKGRFGFFIRGVGRSARDFSPKREKWRNGYKEGKSKPKSANRTVMHLVVSNNTYYKFHILRRDMFYFVLAHCV